MEKERFKDIIENWLKNDCLTEEELYKIVNLINNK